MNILITGAARGIGLELAKRFAARGDRVVATSRDGAPAHEAPGLNWQALEVSDPQSVSQLAARVPGPLDLLVCNAGVYLDKGDALETGFGADLWAQTMAVNVAGVFLTVQAFLPQLRAAQAAKIAIIGSKMGSTARAPGGAFIYRASKAAALNLGRNLAAELAPDGVALGVYHPGWVQTDMGGSEAAITVAQSAEGLIQRVDALSVETTGLFEDFAGESLPF